MSKIEISYEFFCELCNNKVEDLSIVLPCGYSVCEKHLKSNSAQIECFVCKNHQIEIKKCLDMPRNRRILEKQITQTNLAESRKKLGEIKQLRNDLKFYLDQISNDIISKIDLKREELKLDIDNYCNELIQKIKLENEKSYLELEKKIDLVDLSLFGKNLNELEINNQNIMGLSNVMIGNNLEKSKLILSDIESIEKEIKYQTNKFEFVSSEQVFKVKDILGVLNLKQSKIKILKDSISCQKIIEGHQNRITAIKSLSNGDIISSSDDHSIRIWDKETGECIKKLLGHTKTVWCLLILRNGNILSGSWDHKIKLWDPQSGECIKTLDGYGSDIWCLTELKNGNIVSGSSDSKLRIWNYDKEECLKVLNGHNSRVQSVKEFPNGNLISASGDKTLKIWEPNSCLCLKSFEVHTREVWCVEIIDSKKVISCSDDFSIKL